MKHRRILLKLIISPAYIDLIWTRPKFNGTYFCIIFSIGLQ